MVHATVVSGLPFGTVRKLKFKNGNGCNLGPL
jgi:hypothetical protein